MKLKHSGHQHHHPDIPMSDANQKPYTSSTCIKHVKAEGRFKGDFFNRTNKSYTLRFE